MKRRRPLGKPDSIAEVLFQIAGETSAAPVVLAWLVPLTQAEAHFARARGWAALEAVFVEHDPDLTDRGRTSVQLADIRSVARHDPDQPDRHSGARVSQSRVRTHTRICRKWCFLKGNGDSISPDGPMNLIDDP